METQLFMTQWYVWRKSGPCDIRSWMGKETSAQLMEIPRQLCDIQKLDLEGFQKSS